MSIVQEVFGVGGDALDAKYVHSICLANGGTSTYTIFRFFMERFSIRHGADVRSTASFRKCTASIRNPTASFFKLTAAIFRWTAALQGIGDKLWF